ncbi:polysaccharide deacetylase family protein [Actinomadura barringtoniae]|nr:polysaccharide deacetylase family protein [Actinomadura barringtoniae]
MAVLGAGAAVSGCRATAGTSPINPPTVRASPAGGAASGTPADAAVWRRWGLKPMAPAPPAPAEADKPIKLTKRGGYVPIITSVPTKDKVVFVTIDDGKEKDPKFVQMMTDLRIPISMFLTRDSILDNYDYFKPLQALGNHIQNHTLTHPVMSNLGPDGQKTEICGEQKLLTQHYGTAPLLFRPPFGRYNDATQLAADKCGPRALVMWRESMQIHDMQYDEPDKKLRPGDIILAHFRGPDELKGESMVGMFTALLTRIRKQGFAVARLEDYIKAP